MEKINVQRKKNMFSFNNLNNFLSGVLLPKDIEKGLKSEV